MIEKVKLFLGINDTAQDELLYLLIEMAESAFEVLTGAPAANAEAIIIKMVVEDYNRLGSEGITALTFGSGNEATAANYSEQLLKQIRKFRKVKVY